MCQAVQKTTWHQDSSSKWNKKAFGNCQERIKTLTLHIQEIQKKEATENNCKIKARLQQELNEWLLRNETLWRQKSREVWLREGDRNSKFFHISTIIQRKKNTIEALKSDQGSWITEAKEIKKHLSSKFNELFKEDDVEFPADLHNLITPNISVEDNDDLCKIPSTEEINAALFGMPSLKAPSSDGLPILFYKKYWSIVGSDVVKAISSFFHSSKMFKEVNESLIVLIPKVPIPTTANNYRPIGLCNVVCKIIAKLLVDKLRPFLQRLISHCQSAFIPSRWIAENEVIVQELLHSFKQRKVKVGVMAVKLDRLNWPFLQVVLNKFGFDDRFIKWIMECVSSVSHTILVNVGKTDQIFPSRGVRQGDPLSPYLFIMCQDVLSRMLDREILAGRLSGVKASRTNPAVTHIMYADDIVVFSKANSREATILTEWLEKYCSWSGQLINRNKSGVFFSKHTKKPIIWDLLCFLQEPKQRISISFLTR